MRKFLKIIFLLGILFWITFFFNGLFRMYAFNGFGNQFEFVCIDARDYKIVEEANSILFFTYTYMVNGKNYTSEERIASDVFVNGKLLSQSTIKICYNSRTSQSLLVSL